MIPQKRWTKEEDEQLVSLVLAGYPLAKIAAKLDRGVPAVRKRVYALRLSLKRIGRRPNDPSIRMMVRRTNRALAPKLQAVEHNL